MRHLASPAARLLCLFLLAPFASADTITLLDGSTIDGVRIQSETYDKVAYIKPGGRSFDEPSQNVRSIEYATSGPDFRAGMQKLLTGDMIGAAYAFEDASASDRLKDFVRATAKVNAADALLESNNLSAALEAYNELLVDYPETRHLPRALLGKGKTALYKNNHVTSMAAFQQLRKVTTDKKLGGQWLLLADFYTLLTKQAANKATVKELMEGYEDLRNRARGEFGFIANRSALQVARIHLDQQQLSAALPLFNDIIADRFDTDREVVAGAYNGRGRCLFQVAESTRASGDVEGAAADFKDSLLDFLRVHTHYGDAQTAQAEAIYWARQCFKNIGGADSERHAAILRSRLKARYPNSPWAGRLR